MALQPSLTVLRAAPEKTLEYFQVLFENQEKFFDIPASSLTPKQIREQLADLAQPVIGDAKVEQVKDLLTHKTTPNGGTAVTDDLKYNIKVSRHNSIHVSPTVLFDGLIAADVSSSWQEAEWTKFFDSRVTA
ncbi:hypothetical protein FRC02_003340 [Tulasnella sp. 418]|nr:hypothetical protein FRC02_003340 [Tulasnella sp. 418]